MYEESDSSLQKLYPGKRLGKEPDGLHILEVVIRMPTCQDCRFYTAIDELKGECFSLGFEVRGKTDSKKCPERAFRPDKGGPKKKKSGATRY